jgi:hypothetical protein
MQKPVVKIENWGVVQSILSQGFEELRSGNRLLGYVTGHASLPNTKLVCTSPIVRVDLSQGLAETRNTVYQLGEANGEYRSWANRRTASTAA